MKVIRIEKIPDSGAVFIPVELTGDPQKNNPVLVIELKRGRDGDVWIAHHHAGQQWMAVRCGRKTQTLKKRKNRKRKCKEVPDALGYYTYDGKYPRENLFNQNK